MAISPPSDIVLDVARAVDTDGLQAARTQLARRAGSAVPAGVDASFAATVDASTATPEAGAARAADAPAKADTYKHFESMVLQSFIKEMLPTDASAVYGQGMSGDMWKSMMAGKLADAVAERGGIGIANHLLSDHYLDGKVKTPIGPVSLNEQGLETGRREALSNAMVQEMQRRMAHAITDGESIVTGVVKG